MKKLLFVMFLLIAAYSGITADGRVQQQFRAATRFLLNDQPDKALSILNKLKSDGSSEPELFCNIGNVYYKAGKYGKAIACYEKAIAITPRDTQLLHNRAAAIGRLPYSPMALRSPLFKGRLFQVAAIDNCLILSVVVLLLSGLLFVTVSSVTQRRLASKVRQTALALLFSGGAFLVLTSALLAYNTRANHLIVTSKTAITNTGPSKLAKRKGVLKEGDHIQFDEFYKGWYKFSIEGSPAWVNARDVEAIE